MNVENAVTKYLEDLSHTRRKSTVNRANQILKGFVAVHGSRNIKSLTPSDISGFIVKLPHCARTRANHHIRVMALLHHFDIRIKVSSPRYVEKEPETYEPQDLNKFFSACDVWQSAFFETLLGTGLRMQEAKYLEWGDIRNGMLTVKEKPVYGFIPKTCSERTLAIPSQALRIINQMPRRPGTLIFPTKSGKPDKHLLRMCKRVANRAGLDENDWWLHRFRATFATTILRSGIDIKTVQRMMGHAKIESTMRYLKALEPEKLRDRLAEIFSTFRKIPQERYIHPD